MYHQLCSSIFVTSAVFTTLPVFENEYVVGVFDFRFFGPAFFNLLPKLCSLSKNTVDEALVVFNKTKYLSTTLTPEAEMLTRANASLSTLQTQIPEVFRQILQLTRDTTQSNQLLTASFTNAYLKYYYEYSSDVTRNPLEIWWIYPSESTCNCGTSTTACLITFEQYCQLSYLAPIVNCYAFSHEIIKGISIACDPMESALYSTLECLFDTVCLNVILLATQNFSITLGGASGRASLTPLNRTLLSHFYPNTSLVDIVQALMIEKWTSTISFDSYFMQCHPDVCIYTFKQRFDLVGTMVTVIGLAGGLSVALRILTPLGMRLLRRKKSQRPPTVNVAWPAPGNCIFYSLIRVTDH